MSLVSRGAYVMNQSYHFIFFPADSRVLASEDRDSDYGWKLKRLLIFPCCVNLGI